MTHLVDVRPVLIKLKVVVFYLAHEDCNTRGGVRTLFSNLYILCL
jgi:hypothetical protein